MIDDKEIMPFNFFLYGGIYSGDHNGMRYRIKRIGEKPDFELLASVWPGPYCYAESEKDAMQEQSFEYTEQGRLDAIEWLKKKYADQKEKWDTVPAILDAPISMDCYLPIEKEAKDTSKNETNK